MAARKPIRRGTSRSIGGMTAADEPAARPTCILVLQGGGAMGAYHIGAFEALQQAASDPDWVSGISIGAINAAIIAGNPPEQRLPQLLAFWHAIPPTLAATAAGQRQSPVLAAHLELCRGAHPGSARLLRTPSGQSLLR